MCMSWPRWDFADLWCWVRAFDLDSKTIRGIGTGPDGAEDGVC